MAASAAGPRKAKGVDGTFRTREKSHLSSLPLGLFVLSSTEELKLTTLSTGRRLRGANRLINEPSHGSSQDRYKLKQIKLK